MRRAMWMKFWMVCLAGLGIRQAQAGMVTFEDVGATLPAASFNNGGPTDSSTGFTSGGVQFSNNYSTAFGGFWDGWSYSNVTDGFTAGFTNQYAAFPGSGSNSATYGVAFSSTATIQFGQQVVAQSADLTNTTYTGLSMRDGDMFAKQFGGPTGNDPDFYRVTISGLDQGGAVISSLDVYLADYRFADNSLDFIVDDWQSVDLTSLGLIYGLGFDFASSDVGAFGINTPTYFAMDNLDFAAVPEPTSLALLAVAGAGAVYRCRRTARRRAKVDRPRHGAA